MYRFIEKNTDLKSKVGLRVRYVTLVFVSNLYINYELFVLLSTKLSCNAIYIYVTYLFVLFSHLISVTK